MLFKRWSTLKILVSFFSIVFFLSCKEQPKEDTLEKTEKWISLFNGKDLDGWIVKIKGHPLNENFNNTFRVEDSILKVSYDKYDTFDASYGHIFYKKPYSNYKLKLQYRFVGEQVNGGEDWAKKNSGIMIHSQPPESMLLEQNFPVSLEYQLLGGITEGEKRTTGNLCTPGTNVILNKEFFTTHCVDSSSKTYYKDEWITAEAIVYNDSLIIHTIDGKEVLLYSNPVYGGEFVPNTDYWKSMIGKPVKGGYISLQSESHPVEFRNIELLELNN